jgi:hypothetical protein
MHATDGIKQLCSALFNAILYSTQMWFGGVTVVATAPAVI